MGTRNSVSTALLLAAAAKRNRSFSSRRRVMASTGPSLRDTQVLQANLDELLHAHNQANNALTKIDDQEPEDICGTGNKVARQTNWDYPPHRKKNS